MKTVAKYTKMMRELKAELPRQPKTLPKKSINKDNKPAQSIRGYGVPVYNVDAPSYNFDEFILDIGTDVLEVFEEKKEKEKQTKVIN